MRSSGLEPPRAVKPTRPSTLRVYQFRHERGGREYSHGASTALAPTRVGAASAAGLPRAARLRCAGDDRRGRAWLSRRPGLSGAGRESLTACVRPGMSLVYEHVFATHIDSIDRRRQETWI